MGSRRLTIASLSAAVRICLKTSGVNLPFQARASGSLRPDASPNDSRFIAGFKIDAPRGREGGTYLLSVRFGSVSRFASSLYGERHAR
jgi:hypothetical protein